MQKSNGQLADSHMGASGKYSSQSSVMDYYKLLAFCRRVRAHRCVCLTLGVSPWQLSADGCVVVPGSERQVPGAGDRGHAQGAGVPVHRGADSAAGSHLPPPV